MMVDTLTDLNNQGVKLFIAGKFDEAEKLYEEALNADPEHVTTLNNMGMLKLYQKKYTTALQCFDRALKNTRKAVYYLNRGHAKAHLKKFDQAVEDYKMCVALDEKSLNGWISLARTFVATGRKQESIQYFERVVNMDHDPAYKVELAKQLIATGNLEQAEQVLFNAFHEEKLRDVVHYYLGLKAFYEKNYGRSAEHINKALAIKYDNAVYRELLAAIYLAMGDIEKALREWNTVLHQHPDYVKARIDLAVALLGIKYYEDASRQLDRALKTDPENQKAAYYKAVVMHKLGREDALDKLRQIAGSLSAFSEKAQKYLKNIEKDERG